MVRSNKESIIVEGKKLPQKRVEQDTNSFRITDAGQKDCGKWRVFVLRANKERIVNEGKKLSQNTSRVRHELFWNY